MKPKHTPKHFGPGRYCIEGEPFSCLDEALAGAVMHGHAIPSRDSFMRRLYSGASKWTELCAPLDIARSEARKKVASRKRDEMAAVIAALDARKAGMA
jgi:hypothetical protein